MALKDFCVSEVVSAPPDATVSEVAKLMAEKNVGSVVIVEQGKPKGIVTDRDLALRVLAEGRDTSVRISEVMTENVATLNHNLGLFEALESMKEKGVRRYPIVDDDGKLVGIICLDDIIYLLGKEMADITEILEKEAPKL